MNLLPLFLVFFQAMQNRRPKINTTEMIETTTMIVNLCFIFEGSTDSGKKNFKKRDQIVELNLFLW